MGGVEEATIALEDVTSLSKNSRISSRVPIDQKGYVEGVLLPSLIEKISETHKKVAKAAAERASSGPPMNTNNEGSMNKAWQTLTIMLSIALMLLVFLILVLQVYRIPPTVWKKQKFTLKNKKKIVKSIYHYELLERC